jgi:penicillin-binding protein 1A
MAIAFPLRPGIRAANRGRTHIIVRRPRILSRKDRIKRAVAVSAAMVFLALIGVTIFGALKIRSIALHLPPVANLAGTRFHPVTTVVSSDGVLLATFETYYRRPVTLDCISQHLVNATLATEDDRFYRHGGVDLRGIARAVVANISTGNAAGQGGSTITQQLARNLYLSNQKTLRRKIEETLLAGQIEAKYSKHDILEAYLNTIYYGNGCYGAEAASQAYFHKPAYDLALGEAALLAGLPQRPAAFSPVQHLPDALKRRSEVLKRLVATGKISSDDAARANSTPIHVFRPHLQAQSDWKAPYFVAHVLTELRDRFGPEYLYGGARIVTTLNWQMQQAAERSLRQGLSHGAGPNTGALVALDPLTGAIRALVGGADFKKDQFDAATQGIRQPGSAFKPIVYAAAFDANLCNLANTIEDKKLVYHDSPRDWVVHNYDGHYLGPVSVLEAIRQSINTVAVQVAEQTGLSTVQAYGRQLGLSTPMSLDLPLALGASGVRPIELCSAFSAFANGGARYEPYCVQEATVAQCKEIYRDEPTTRLHASFMNSSTVDQINVALREVVLNGTGMAVSAVPDAHGKTGTTSSHRDAWFVGYTGNLAAVVWMGHAEKHRTKDGRVVVNYRSMPGATGGGICAPVWARFMKSALPVQERVNTAHGMSAAVVRQPGKDQLIGQLQAELSQTGIEEAQSQEQVSVDGSAAGGLWAAREPNAQQQDDGSMPTVAVNHIVKHAMDGGEPPEQRDDADMSDGVQEGYRVSDQQTDKIGE